MPSWGLRVWVLGFGLGFWSGFEFCVWGSGFIGFGEKVEGFGVWDFQVDFACGVGAGSGVWLLLLKGLGFKACLRAEYPSPEKVNPWYIYIYIYIYSESISPKRLKGYLPSP